MGDKIVHIASLMLGLAMVTLILNRYDAASTLVATTGQTFGGLLNILTLQNGMGGYGGYAGRRY